MIEDYKEAKKRADKAYKNAVTSGRYPYLPSLEDFTSMESFSGEEPLGIIDIPLNRIAGTKTAGRKNSFAENFMPLLSDSSEFAVKWSNLYDSQLEEGIHDPIKAYEYMSRYYVQEGNKRVSVLKFVGATTISANVTRLLPAKKDDDPEIKKYFEYIKFYNSTHITTIYCDTEDGYEILCKYYGKALEDTWTDDELLELRSDFDRFDKVYEEIGKDKISVNAGDAFLTYLKVYGHEAIHFQSDKDLRNDISRIWTEFKTNSNDGSVKLMLNPTKGNNGGLISHLFSAAPKKSVVGFIYGKTPETSAWTYAHDLGRAYIENIYGDNIVVKTYENAEAQFSPSEVVNQAVEDGCNIIFTTTPYLGAASLKAAVAHPNVKILNCATNSTYSSVRTYYCRMYETKFLLGAIAGAMSKNRKIGYIADYPIHSSISNINAFALGARTTNPDVKIQLTWSSLKSDLAPEDRLDSDIVIISGRDFIVPNNPGKDFGLYKRVGGEISTLATTICDWGKFYWQILESIKTDAYKSDLTANKDRAINYWWGISAGVTELICSDKLPKDLVRMINILTEEIAWDRYRPFDTELKDNNGNLIQPAGAHMRHTEIMKMNWLLDNVEGTIPSIDELVDEALTLVLLQGDPKEKTGE